MVLPNKVGLTWISNKVAVPDSIRKIKIIISHVIIPVKNLNKFIKINENRTAIPREPRIAGQQF